MRRFIAGCAAVAIVLTAGTVFDAAPAQARPRAARARTYYVNTQPQPPVVWVQAPAVQYLNPQSLPPVVWMQRPVVQYLNPQPLVPTAYWALH
ncbi:MAG TPA: hypothetical protein VHV55_00475 [Pirellulales bacterium]|jgi:hypothetical protein|nr:hypothetical protein [Pirellulales bacterium]